MRKRTLLVALAGLAVVVAARGAAMWPHGEPSRLTWDNVCRIRGAMSRAWVHAILGPPGG
jgi:hypothetical protein